jgi:hypothetical protein
VNIPEWEVWFSMGPSYDPHDALTRVPFETSEEGGDDAEAVAYETDQTSGSPPPEFAGVMWFRARTLGIGIGVVVTEDKIYVVNLTAPLRVGREARMGKCRANIRCKERHCGGMSDQPYSGLNVI